MNARHIHSARRSSHVQAGAPSTTSRVTTTSAAEGRYLVGILNSATLLARVTPLQAVGLFGPRDFDKNVFYVPFPTYDPDNEAHRHIATLVEKAESIAATVEVSTAFTATRAAVRAALEADGVAADIEAAVNAVLPVLNA